jgi:hypothetical protein
MVSKHRERTYGARRSPHWIRVKNPKPSSIGSRQGWAMVTCDQKVTLGQMRQMGRSRPPGLLAELQVRPSRNISGDNWRTMVRLSDVEPCFVSQWCGERAPIRLDHADSNRHQLRAKPSFEGFRSVCPRPSGRLQRGPELPAFLAREDQSPPVSSHFSHGR